MKLKSWILIAGIATSGLLAGGSFDRAQAVTTTFYDLYDGSSGVTPDLYNSPNTYLGFTNLFGASQVASGGVTTFTTPESTTDRTYAGYSNYNIAGNLVNPSSPILLDNNAGYTLSFKVKINSQANTSPDRAGFSVIVLGNDQKGIEIGFRNSDIFSQSGASFTVGEQNSDPSLVGILGSLTTYDLTVSKNSNPLLANLYTLTNGGNTLLNGSLRDYTAATGPLSAVYRTSNLIFLGDDTTSAGASVDISKITLATNSTAVPEPSSLLGIGLAIGLGATIKGRLSKIGRKVNKLSK
jgi:hypothetical protein